MLNMVWTDNRLRYRIINDDDEYNDYINSDEELVPVPDKEKYDRELALLQNELPSYVAFPLKLEQFRKPYLDALCHVNKTWTPDVYFIKHGDFRQHIDPRHLSLRIFANGTVNFTTRLVIIIIIIIYTVYSPSPIKLINRLRSIVFYCIFIHLIGNI